MLTRHERQRPDKAMINAQGCHLNIFGSPAYKPLLQGALWIVISQLRACCDVRGRRRRARIALPAVSLHDACDTNVMLFAGARAAVGVECQPLLDGPHCCRPRHRQRIHRASPAGRACQALLVRPKPSFVSSSNRRRCHTVLLSRVSARFLAVGAASERSAPYLISAAIK